MTPTPYNVLVKICRAPLIAFSGIINIPAAFVMLMEGESREGIEKEYEAAIKNSNGIPGRRIVIPLMKHGKWGRDLVYRLTEI